MELMFRKKELNFTGTSTDFRIRKEFTGKSLNANTKRNIFGFRKLYSYYRVTSALLESVTIIIVIILLMFNNKNKDVCKDADSHDYFILNEGNNYNRTTIINLMELRMAHFLGIKTNVSNCNDPNFYLVRDIVMTSSLVYSLLIIVTALVKYWHQAKNVSISWMGQIVLGLYLGFLIINKLTTSISLLNTSRVVKVSQPGLTLFLSLLFIFLLVFIRIGVVYVYKRKFSRSWFDGDKIDQWMNVFVNTFVIIPFSVSQDPVMELKHREAKFVTARDKHCSARRRSDPSFKKAEILKTASNASSRDQLDNSFQAKSDDLREEVLKIWWKNPRVQLTLERAKRKLVRKYGKIVNNEEFIDSVCAILSSLEDIGLINTPLLAPAQKRHEYFALFVMVVVENIISLMAEWMTGGVGIDNGKYYSWDIRLWCLALALVCLLSYYYKYHSTGDTCDSWCSCSDHISADPPSENVMRSIIVQEEISR